MLLPNRRSLPRFRRLPMKFWLSRKTVTLKSCSWMSRIFPPSHMLPEAGIRGESLFSHPAPGNRKGCTIFGAYEPKNHAFYWKSSNKGNAVNFKQFVHQLRSRAKGRTLVFIMDNVSYHYAKSVELFRQNYNDLKFFFLPPYSPEYNPTEEVWRWSKQLVYAAKTITGGLDKLLSRFRKLFVHRRNDRLATTLNVGPIFWKIIH